jgi:hypothetical protein
VRKENKNCFFAVEIYYSLGGVRQAKVRRIKLKLQTPLYRHNSISPSVESKSASKTMASELTTEVEKAIKNVEDSRIYKLIQSVLGLMGPAGEVVNKVMWVLSLFASEEVDVWTQLETNITLKVVISRVSLVLI